MQETSFLKNKLVRRRRRAKRKIIFFKGLLTGEPRGWRGGEHRSREREHTSCH